MPLIDRNNIEDAKKRIENFLPDKDGREILLNFLAERVVFANRLNNGNWNLNLDKDGYFLRFNTGREYCIEISYKRILILCIKEVLKKNLVHRNLDIEFRGYLGRRKIVSSNLEDIPNCLVKVPDSVGCYIKHDKILEYLPFLEDANKKFIESAVNNTIISPQMKDAHSIGVIAYLSKITKKNLPNPCYTITEKDFKQSQEKLLAQVKKMTDSELEKKVFKATGIPQKTNIITTQYVRNEFISEFVKRQAQGICQDCKQPAPFISKQTGEPFLETHHIIRLADGGKDIIENIIALCPNCHRKRHYGK